jgi:hypothetical protein
MIKVEFTFSSIDELREFLAPKYDTSFDVDELERQLAESKKPPVVSEIPLTMVDLREAILDASNRGQSSAVRELLTRYGVKKASELPEHQWRSFHTEVSDLGS